jgi:hypothetical protein
LNSQTTRIPTPLLPNFKLITSQNINSCNKSSSPLLVETAAEHKKYLIKQNIEQKFEEKKEQSPFDSTQNQVRFHL